MVAVRIALHSGQSDWVTFGSPGLTVVLREAIYSLSYTYYAGT